MKRCRCCRQSWPEEFFTVCRPDGLRRSTCMACRKGCKRFAQRYYHRHRDLCVARTRAWKAELRAAVEQVRLARARAKWDNGAGGVSTEPNRLPAATVAFLLTPGDGRRAASGSKTDA